MRTARVVVLGGDHLRESVVALGLEPCVDGPGVVLVDLRDRTCVERAAALDRDMPRVFIAGEQDRRLAAAFGIDPLHVVGSHEPAILGPVLMAALPTIRRAPTRTVLVCGVRGGVGATLLATNLARRAAGKLRVCVIDATGSGCAAWWLRSSATPWPELEGLVDEMTPDHLAIIATEVAADLRLVGGPPATPSAALLVATVRAATSLHDLVIVDAPPAPGALTRDLGAHADRRLLLTYDDPWSRATLASQAPDDDVWIIASQSRLTQIEDRAVFRALPRDEPAIADAVAHRKAVGGALGAAYDALVELLLIDAT